MAAEPQGAPLPQSAEGFPNIPDPFRPGFTVTYTGLKTTRYLFDYGPDYYTPVEVSGLYWHFVDIVWIFLFPLLYLIGRHLH